MGSMSEGVQVWMRSRSEGVRVWLGSRSRCGLGLDVDLHQRGVVCVRTAEVVYE